MAETSRPLSVGDRSSIAEQIKDKVSRFTLTYTWLIHRLSDEGLLTDKFEMSATLSGTRIGPKADEILCRSLDILNEYGRRSLHEKGFWNPRISLIFLHSRRCRCCGTGHDGSRRRHGLHGYRPWLLPAVL